MRKMQREQFLRRQLEVIRSELGEGESEEIAELRKKRRGGEHAGRTSARSPTASSTASSASRRSRRSGRSRATTSNGSSSCRGASRPTTTTTSSTRGEVLDEDHYGLEKIKDRIIEYLAVQKLQPEGRSPILCFVGPPGRRQDVARTVDRARARTEVPSGMSLGGVRDEAEIRGHRRTYIGAMPGRIVQGLRKAGSLNPVMMLDEVDKLGADFRGDPSAALLEVLDPEQNNSFSDHYLEVPIDLSHVLFICTANILDTIPPPLRDRMEIIELRGYTEPEKVAIAKQYLIPRQLEANGLTAKQAAISIEALRRIVREYTYEAGVRNLEREIGGVFRKIATRVAIGDAPRRRSTVGAEGPRGVPRPPEGPPGHPRADPTRSASSPGSRGRRSAATSCSSRRA